MKDLEPFKYLIGGIGIGAVILALVVAVARWWFIFAALAMVAGAVYVWAR